MTSQLLLILALLAPAQSSKAPPIRWYANWDEAKAQAKLRNAVIFLTFQEDGSRKGRLQLMSTFQNPPFAKLADEDLIMVIAHRGAEKGEEHEPEAVQDPRTGATVYQCPLYGDVKCAEHEALERQLSSEYPHKEKPATFLLDPEGKVLVDDTGFSPRGDIAIKKVKEAQSKLEGSTLGMRDFRKIQMGMDKAEGLLVDEKFKLAIAAFQKVAKSKRITEPLKAKVDAALDDVNQIGLQMIEEGKKVHADDPAEGMKILKTVLHEFKELDAGARAKEAIAEIEGGSE